MAVQSEVKYDGDDVSSECLDEYGMLKNEYAEKIKEKNYDKTNAAAIRWATTRIMLMSSMPTQAISER